MHIAFGIPRACNLFSVGAPLHKRGRAAPLLHTRMDREAAQCGDCQDKPLHQVDLIDRLRGSAMQFLSLSATMVVFTGDGREYMHAWRASTMSRCSAAAWPRPAAALPPTLPRCSSALPRCSTAACLASLLQSCRLPSPSALSVAKDGCPLIADRSPLVPLPGLPCFQHAATRRSYTIAPAASARLSQLLVLAALVVLLGVALQRARRGGEAGGKMEKAKVTLGAAWPVLRVLACCTVCKARST